MNCGERGAVVFPCIIPDCLAVTSPAEDLATAPGWSCSERTSLKISCSSKTEAADWGKDLHGSTFHQGLDELQQVSGDDREGILHEQLQVSHNLDKIGHGQMKGNVAYLVTKYSSAEGIGRFLSSLFHVIDHDI